MMPVVRGTFNNPIPPKIPQEDRKLMEVCRSCSLEGSQRAADQAGRDCLQTSDCLGLGPPGGIQRDPEGTGASPQEMITPDDRDDATSVLVGNLSFGVAKLGQKEGLKRRRSKWINVGELM